MHKGCLVPTYIGPFLKSALNYTRPYWPTLDRSWTWIDLDGPTRDRSSIKWYNRHMWPQLIPRDIVANELNAIMDLTSQIHSHQYRREHNNVRKFKVRRVRTQSFSKFEARYTERKNCNTASLCLTLTMLQNNTFHLLNEIIIFRIIIISSMLYWA